jgi:hypothetical protein
VPFDVLPLPLFPSPSAPLELSAWATPPGGSQIPAANLNQTVTKSKSAATIEDHPMQYFDNIAGKPERIGKVIGDGLAVLVYVFVLFLMFWHFA